jgi:sialate O-acetylesterase
MAAAVALTTCAAAGRGQAGVKTARIFNNRMVLQRDQPVPVWGTSNAHSPITVRIADNTVETRADEKGQWRVTLPPMRAGGPHSLTVSGISRRRRRTIHDVLIGDVWVCSGQSNMQYPIKGRWRVVDADAVIAAAKYPQIRESNGYGWVVCSPGTAARFSAVGYFFARKLHWECRIPIGILKLSYNASSIEQWMPGNDERAHGTRFKNKMGHILGYGIRGFVWYQGETNVARAQQYGAQLKSLIMDWRRLWNAKEAPFIIVQVAPYRGYAKKLPTLWAQQMSALELPNTGFVVTTDVAELDNIHPPRKREIGERAAAWALANAYAKDHVVPSGPVLKEATLDDGRVAVTFDHIVGGLKTSDGEPPDWFELAGSDGTFKRAEALIDGERVLVRHADIAAPTVVRFGWNGVARPNLVNSAGLPARPFAPVRIAP